jgi:hypothetical protein
MDHQRKSKLFAKLFSDIIPMKLTQQAIPSLGKGGVTEEWLRQLFDKCADIRIRKFELGEPDCLQTVLLVSCEGLADMRQFNQYILPRLEQMSLETSVHPEWKHEIDLVRFEKLEEIVTRVFSGQLVLYFSSLRELFSLDVANMPNRNPEESNTEISIKGPRDAFVENLNTNVALVRKRLKTTSLCYEQFTIGTRSESKVALLYMEDFIRPEIIKEARKRLKHIDIEALLGSSQFEEILSDSSYSLFPLLTYTGRPDFVVDCLTRGRFAIIVDDSPIAVIAPVNLSLLMKSPEDIYSPVQIVWFELFIRNAGLVIALFLPGFWLALASYNMEQLPFPLLATLVMARHGLPLPGPLEAFLMIGLFELFKEAGIRLPKAVGQTIAVVGGIIVGDAVIRAGLASTTMLVVSGLTAVATFTLVNQTLSSAVSIARLFIMLSSSLLGMYGFILSSITLVLYFAKLESFGVPYLAPLSPISPKELFAAIFKIPLKYSKRPQFVQKEDTNRRGDNL